METAGKSTNLPTPVILQLQEKAKADGKKLCQLPSFQGQLFYLNFGLSEDVHERTTYAKGITKYQGVK
jgi:hypothetical protein